MFTSAVLRIPLTMVCLLKCQTSASAEKYPLWSHNETAARFSPCLFIKICSGLQATKTQHCAVCPTCETFQCYTNMSAMNAIVSSITRGAAVDEIRIITDRRPITTNSVSSQRFDPATIQQDYEATRIVIHERFPQLVVDFLNHKRQYGSQVERALYNDPEWTWRLQVARLGTYTRGTFLNVLFTTNPLIS